MTFPFIIKKIGHKKVIFPTLIKLDTSNLNLKVSFLSLSHFFLLFTRPTLSQFESLNIRRSAIYIRFGNVVLRVLKLQICERVSRAAA